MSPFFPVTIFFLLVSSTFFFTASILTLAHVHHLSRSHFSHFDESHEHVDTKDHGGQFMQFHDHSLQHLEQSEFTPAPVVENVCGLKVKGECVPRVRCPLRVGELEGCKLPHGGDGICCIGERRDVKSGSKSRSSIAVKKDVLHKALNTGRSQASALFQKESRLSSSGRAAHLMQGTPSFGHFRHFHVSDPEEQNQIQELSQQAMEITLATRALKESQGYTNEQLEFNELESDLHGSSLESACTKPHNCPLYPSRFRTLDGSCNNPLDTYLGVSETPYSRLLPPSYGDGVWSPRSSIIHNQPLPSPRVISMQLFSEVDRPDHEHTLLLMQFGQFLAHDISRSIPTRFANGSGISCCSNDGSHELPSEMRHFACMPIIISPQDYFYKNFGQRCMNFVRSVLAPRQECNLGYSQQMNRVSHFLDGSAIYGNDASTLSTLREFSSGRLKMFKDFGRDLLPLTKVPTDCLTMESGSACFMAGDSRCNQMVSLIAVHTLFAREHNRLAEELAMLNPHWNDELLFLEARKIVIGVLQNIVYKEWLPEVIGHRATYDFGLNVDNYEYSMQYDPNIDPSVTNEFTAAAMRFGHSIVDGKMKLYGHNKMEEIIDIPDVMFHPAKMRKQDFFDEILTTLTVESPQMVDTSVPDALTKYMFRGGFPFGLDLISINIQRGRDHGLRSYNDYRELIGLKRYQQFEEFGTEIGQALQSIYASPEDVDLYVGGLIERRTSGSIVGPTFRDLIADQFVRLRKGDRYFYDLHPTINPGFFTHEQLREIKLSSMARIICDNSDGLLLVKQAINPFRKPGIPGNEVYDCSNPIIPHMNLIYWHEKHN